MQPYTVHSNVSYMYSDDRQCWDRVRLVSSAIIQVQKKENSNRRYFLSFDLCINEQASVKKC